MTKTNHPQVWITSKMLAYVMKRVTIFVLLLTAQLGYAASPRLFREKSFTAITFAEAVNHFVSLGEDAAIRELGTLSLEGPKDTSGHRRDWDADERIGWMLRVLYDSRDKQPIRQPLFGGLFLPDQMPLSNWPLYPVALSGKTYFVLSEGYTLAGRPEPLKDYIEHCRINGVFRTSKVILPTRSQALHDLAILRKSKEWLDIKWIDSGEGSWDEAWVWKFIQGQAERIR